MARALFLTLATGGRRRTFGSLGLGLWRRRLGDLGWQQAHFLKPIQRLGLAAHLEDSFGLLASAVHGNVVEFGHIGILVKSVSSEYPDRISGVLQHFFDGGLTGVDTAEAVFAQGYHA